jgi:pilus assembly protein TadC
MKVSIISVIFLIPITLIIILVPIFLEASEKNKGIKDQISSSK